jgi:hypothetical protein
MWVGSQYSYPKISGRSPEKGKKIEQKRRGWRLVAAAAKKRGLESREGLCSPSNQLIRRLEIIY